MRPQSSLFGLTTSTEMVQERLHPSASAARISGRPNHRARRRDDSSSECLDARIGQKGIRFVEYFLKTYLEGNFPTILWNHYESEERNNNRVEANNRKMKVYCGTADQCMAKCVKLLQTYDVTSTVMYENAKGKDAKAPQQKLDDTTKLEMDLILLYKSLEKERRNLTRHNFIRKKILQAYFNWESNSKIITKHKNAKKLKY